MLNPLHDDATANPFVGREAEFRVLRGALERMLAGHGQVALLAGEAGIGKTRTAEELARLARDRGALVLWGRCREWEGAPPYWPWVQIARAGLRDHDPAELLVDADLSIAVLAQLVPELRARVSGSPQLPEQAEAARFLLFDVFTQWLKAVAEQQPLVLILDDLHRADTPSLLLLQFLAAELDDSRILLLGAWRDDEVDRDHPLTAALAELRRATQRVTLRGWEPDEAEQFICLSAGRELPAQFVSTILRETEGNPFFVTELMRSLAEEGLDRVLAGDQPSSARVPASVREVILQRIARLSNGCATALSAAAIVGREFRLPILQSMLNQPPAELLDAFDEARRARIIDEAEPPGSFRFTHVLIRETLAQTLTASEQARRHQLAGEAIERFHAGNLAPHAADLAYHFAQALPIGDAAKAIAYGRLAGERAMEQVAWESAVEHYERVLSLLDIHSTADETLRCDVLLALGAARWRAGDITASRAAYDAAAELARAMSSAERLARAALGVSGFDFTGGIFPGDDAAVMLVEEALAAQSQDDSELRVLLLSQLSTTLTAGPDLVARRLALTDEAVSMARRLGSAKMLLYALDKRWYALAAPEHLAERLAIGAECVRIAEQIGDRQMLLASHSSQALDLLVAGDVPAFDRENEIIARLADEQRSLPWQFLLFQVRTMRALINGRFDAVEPLVEQMRALGHRLLAGSITDTSSGRCLFGLRREQDRLAEIEDWILEIAGFDAGDGVFWQACHALLYASVGRHANGRAMYERLVAGLDEIPIDGVWLATLSQLAELAALFDDDEHAAAIYDRLLQFADLNATSLILSFCHGSVSHYLGLLATTLKHWDAAERHFADALAMHERMDALLFATWTRAAWAEMLAGRPARGDRQRARELANQALIDAEMMGSIRIATRMRTLLESLLAVARPASPYGLSPRELDVLRLIVEGKTDREIAEALFISPRTVMRHVTGLLNKLGVNSRTAAATLAIRENIT